MSNLEIFISVFNYLDTHNWIVPCILSAIAIIQSITSYKLARNVFELEVSRMISDSLNSLSNAKTTGIVGKNGTDELSADFRDGYSEAIFEYLNVLNQACFFMSKHKISRGFFNHIVMFRIDEALAKKNYLDYLNPAVHKHLYKIYQSSFQNSDK